MIFKRLSDSDLKELEKEFVDFLVLNGITADDWVALKDEKPQSASQMVDSFSDAIYAGMMRKVQYLERITKSEIMCFYCQPEQIVLVGIESTNPSVDFTEVTDFSNLKSISQDIQVYTTSKQYDKPRELEIFEMIENGAAVGDKSLFTALCMAL